MATTPGIALMTKLLKADGGIVVTASHNPAMYNGIKFLQPIGTGLTAATAEKLKAIWQGGQFTLADVDHQGIETSQGNTHGMHVDTVCSAVDVTSDRQPSVSRSCWTASTAPAAS